MPLSGKTSMNPVMANARLNMLVLKWNLMRLLFCVRVDLKAVLTEFVQKHSHIRAPRRLALRPREQLLSCIVQCVKLTYGRHLNCAEVLCRRIKTSIRPQWNNPWRTPLVVSVPELTTERLKMYLRAQMSSQVACPSTKPAACVQRLVHHSRQPPM